MRKIAQGHDAAKTASELGEWLSNGPVKAPSPAVASAKACLAPKAGVAAKAGLAGVAAKVSGAKAASPQRDPDDVGPRLDNLAGSIAKDGVARATDGLVSPSLVAAVARPSPSDGSPRDGVLTEHNEAAPPPLPDGWPRNGTSPGGGWPRISGGGVA